MRWPVSISVILIAAGTALVLYAATFPVYTKPDTPDRLSEKLAPTESMKEGDTNARFEEWFAQLRAYETPHKKLSDLGRGLCAAGLGLLGATTVWVLYHRKMWMRKARAIFLLWLLLWAIRFPLSIWYFQIREFRFDYPVWGDSIAIGIFDDWTWWTVGALASSLALGALLRGYRFSGETRWRKPKSIYGWLRAILLLSWMALLAAGLTDGISDGNEGSVITSIVASVVLIIFLTAEHAESIDRHLEPI